MENTGLKSVKDIAKELNTTPQTIYKYVNRLEDKYIKKVSNVIHVTPEGVDRVKSEYYFNNPVDSAESKTEINQDVYDLLKDQIKIKDKQIEALLKTNESLNERIREINHLIALERKEKALQGNIEPLNSDLKHNVSNNEPLEQTKEDITPKLGRSNEQKEGIFERLKYLFTGKRNNGNE